VFDTLVGSDHVTIERIVSFGQSSPAEGWGDQQTNEWVIVLHGTATILIGGEQQLTAGSYLNIPAAQWHKVLWTTPDEETVWLAVHY
jgi:cupin 2 domain-containing protein